MPEPEQVPSVEPAGATEPAPSAAVTDPTPAPQETPGAEPSLRGGTGGPDDEWRGVSPKHVVVEVVGSVIGAGIAVAALLVASAWFDLPFAAWIAAAVGVIALVSIVLEPRRVRSIRYRLRADDLVFRRGIMYQRQVAVPYGRMQLVDITRGPVSRALGLADLKFVTAAAATAVTLPGLPLEEAERLRDHLVALAETRRAGL
ncbi:MAG TPA: PH domain-containing protein [Agromyces sp.]|jgi:membrane protein YdbS with pleckstrin-like domain|nr:PH domain-containing protein [Agromyces sp.]